MSIREKKEQETSGALRIGYPGFGQNLANLFEKKDLQVF